MPADRTLVPGDQIFTEVPQFEVCAFLSFEVRMEPTVKASGDPAGDFSEASMSSFPAETMTAMFSMTA